MNPILAQAETEAHLLNGRFDRFAAQNARGGTPDMFPVGARVLVSSVSRGGIPLRLEAATITDIHNGVMSARFDYGLSVLILRRTYVEAYPAPDAPETVNITPRDGGWMVEPVWAGVDRPVVGGWLLRERKLADRLAAAVLAGVVYPQRTVRVDTGGKTYVQANSKVMGKYANADLIRLGF